MRYRLLAAVLVCTAIGMAQSLSVAQLITFLESSEKFILEGKMSDREVAQYLSRIKLKEKLDDRTIETFQGRTRLGPKTLEALHELRDRTKTLVAAAPLIEPVAPPPIPPPSSEEQAAIIDHAREYALSYSKRLPDFICTQVTRRFGAPAPGTRFGGHADAEPRWQSLDTLQIRLSYFEQKEDYKLILINNSYTQQDYRAIGGATAAGDFGTMMRQIFERGTQARFEWERWATLRGRRTMVFAYHVAQANSQWHILYERQFDVVPAYSGEVFVDKETQEITRITLSPEKLPPDFPVRRAETKLDYQYEDISGRKFLLPMKSETIMATSEYVTRNDTEFRLYRKYSADSDIKFDIEPLPPLPEEKTKEIPDPKVTKKQ